MHTEIDLLDTLHELRQLYAQGELREWDFDCKISQLEQAVTEFEQHYSEHNYSPSKEV